ncbi:MAG TPA: hypothetical protein EYP61_01105 [Candidatus Latescibacteria bacterium]|nr:hypothetical protein [Candidatus Latescibacterota bacterium]
MRWIWLALLWPAGSYGSWPSSGEREIYGGVGVEYRRWRLDDRGVASKRWDFRASYGLKDWLDVRAEVGMAALDISSPGPGWTELRADYRPLLGVGARLRILRLGTSVAYLDVEGLIFRPSGAMVYTMGADTLRSEVDYRPWGEYFLSLGLAVPSWRTYGAIVLQGVATEGERRLVEEGKVLDGRWESYRSGVRWALILGRQVKLGKDFRLKAEVWASSDVLLGKSYEDLAVRVELVQRYVPEEEPF